MECPICLTESDEDEHVCGECETPISTKQCKESHGLCSTCEWLIQL